MILTVIESMVLCCRVVRFEFPAMWNKSAEFGHDGVLIFVKQKTHRPMRPDMLGQP